MHTRGAKSVLFHYITLIPKNKEEGIVPSNSRVKLTLDWVMKIKNYGIFWKRLEDLDGHQRIEKYNDNQGTLKRIEKETKKVESS